MHPEIHFPFTSFSAHLSIYLAGLKLEQMFKPNQFFSLDFLASSSPTSGLSVAPSYVVHILCGKKQALLFAFVYLFQKTFCCDEESPYFWMID